MITNLETSTTFQYEPGVRIHYELRGRGKRPAVLLHGFGASLEMWRDIQPFLESDLSMYLVDLKGFGLSSKPKDEKYSIEDQATIVASFIERMGLSGVSLIGHSFGGAVAAMTYLKLSATRFRGAVHSLVLIDSPAAVQRLPFFIAPLQVPLLSTLVGILPARYRARFVLSHISSPGLATEKRVERYAQFHDLPGAHEAMIATARQIVPKNRDSLCARLGKIRVPVLIVWGDRDDVVLRWQADLMKEQIPDSELVVIPNCGHIPPEERPEQTAREILRFLAR